MKTYVQKNSGIKYSDHWSTPSEIYLHYVRNLNYVDPCPLYGETKPTNLKRIEYSENMFINPLYSNISEWIDFALNHHKAFKQHIVLLIPSRTDTKYFHRLLEYGVTLEFIKGRLKFGGSKNTAPFPSVLVHIQ